MSNSSEEKIYRERMASQGIEMVGRTREDWAGGCLHIGNDCCVEVKLILKASERTHQQSAAQEWFELVGIRSELDR